MNRSEISNALAECLARIRAGATIDEVVMEYPYLADQLRDLLALAQSVRMPEKAARIPSSAQMDSRRRMLTQARDMKKKKGEASLWAVLYFFKRNAGSFAIAIAAITLLFIALGSAQALPGDGLYGVKIAAEKAGSSINFGPASPSERQENYDNRRVSEVNQMILEKRTGTVRIAGFLDPQDPSGWKMDGVTLDIANQLEKQAQEQTGIYVDVTGFLNNQGRVVVKEIRPRLINISGTLQSIAEGLWKVNNQEVKIDQNTRIQGNPQTGKVVYIEAAMLRNSKQILAITVTLSKGMELETADPAVQPSGVMPTEEPSVTPSIETTRATNRQELPTPVPSEKNNQPNDNKTPDHGGSSGGDGTEHEGGN